MSNEEERSPTSKSPEQPNLDSDSVVQHSTRSSSSPRGQAPQQIQYQFVNHEDIHPQSVIDQHSTPDTQPSQHTDEMGGLAQQQTFPVHMDSSRLSYPYIDQASQSILQNDSTSLFPMTIPDSLSIPQNVRPNNPQHQESDMPLADPHVDLVLNPSLADPNPGSALNWISTDLLKDTEDALPLDPDLLQQSVQQWWPESFDTSITWLSPMDNLDQLPLFNHFQHNLLDAVPPVESPGRHSSVSQDGSLFSGSNDDSVLSGEYYVNGEGSRCPKYSRKRKERWNIAENIIPLLQNKENSKEESNFSFPAIQYIQTDNSNLGATMDKQISPAIYENMISSFENICRRESLIFTPFAAGHFPTSELLTYFVRHYLDGFQPVYPIFHVATFDPNETHWILVLAISAIGCNYVNSAEAAQYSQPLHEFVRRAILVERQKSALEYTPLWLMQAVLLNCIGLIHSGNTQNRDYGLNLFGELVRLAHHEGLFSTNSQNQEQDSRRQWRHWIENETNRRTGYLVWLVDTTLAYTTDSPPQLCLKDVQTPLPAHESLWEANSEYVWQSLYQEENASLYSAMEILFIEKRLTPGIGEFSHVLLLHALYQRLWEVGDYFQRPLSWWTPTAERRTRESVLPSKAVWLPGIPLFSKWRNSACDCLDTLHWSANGTIAKAAGLEHPTVLHLHTARLVLLVPFREIRNLAMSLARQEVSWEKLNQTPEWRHVWRWGKHDQYKARLSIIHAGSVIWYVRRYSTNAFHEPIAVFLATLTLWAYGLCHQSQDQPDSPSSQHATLTSSASPTFIHVDRPCDDEIVQLFVRVGQTMRGNVTGVGDICGPHGPSRILQEGIHILSGLVSAWGVAREYIDILSRMGNQVVFATPARSGEW